MRILTKTSLYYALVSVAVFLVGGILFYTTMREEIYDEVDDQLFTDKENIINYIRVHDRLPNVTSGISEAILVKEANMAAPIMEQLADTLIFSTYDEEYIPYRRLTFTAYQGDKPYEYTILKSLMDFQDLVESTVLAMLWTFVLLLIGLFFVNYLVSRHTWQNFYSTLYKIKRYRLAQQEPLQLSATNIKEFKELNEVITSMTDKIHSDYINLKEFTEDASHEIQTPLAVVKSKIELFMQSDNLTSEQAGMLSDMYGAINRLSRLNKSLILLTRIENREFQVQDEVPLQEVIKEQVSILQEFAAVRNITLQALELEEVYLKMNRGLAEVLVTNLLNNAIKHNHDNGYIRVYLTADKLCVANSGAKLEEVPDYLFRRFKRASAAVESLGIGLALVKKISEVYSFRYEYQFKEEHKLCIHFDSRS
ncbi:HAMP domain-containing sensor histidine kinase [uncultured Pontibacter sp.]|uniref:sensor histidine kinase n=1 Tax=uncultured Pontibacter sp. TaxID=453356 RepID=UPI0026089B9D|nr:HAMP domain-containing sensor histidine kinase [uncultured Pontibacter sp.]